MQPRTRTLPAKAGWVGERGAGNLLPAKRFARSCCFARKRPCILYRVLGVCEGRAAYSLLHPSIASLVCECFARFAHVQYLRCCFANEVEAIRRFAKRVYHHRAPRVYCFARSKYTARQHCFAHP